MARLKDMVKKQTPKKQKPIPVKIVSEPRTYPSEDKKWKAQSDLRTLQEAEAIKNDKERLSNAKNMAKEQMNDLKKIC